MAKKELDKVIEECQKEQSAAKDAHDKAIKAVEDRHEADIKEFKEEMDGLDGEDLDKAEDKLAAVKAQQHEELMEVHRVEGAKLKKVLEESGAKSREAKAAAK